MKKKRKHHVYRAPTGPTMRLPREAARDQMRARLDAVRAAPIDETTRRVADLVERLTNEPWLARKVAERFGMSREELAGRLGRTLAERVEAAKEGANDG